MFDGIMRGHGEWTSGNIRVRVVPFSKQHPSVTGDVHNFDHTTLFLSGEWDATYELPDGTIEKHHIVAPDFALIRANVKHTFEMKSESALMWCVYAHRDSGGNVVTGPTGSHAPYR